MGVIRPTHHLVGINIQGHAAGRHAQRVKPRLGIVHRSLQVRGHGGQLRQLRHRGAIHLLDGALVRRNGVKIRKDGVAGQPIEISAQAAAGGPMVRPPEFRVGKGQSYCGVGAGRGEIAPASGVGGEKIPTPGQVEHLPTGAGQSHSRGGKLALVHKPNRHRHAKNADRLGLGNPVKVGIHEQCIITAQRCEVMTIGVAVGHRIHNRPVVGVHNTVPVLIGDVVVLLVNGLARADALGEVPDKAVINRRGLDPGNQDVVAPAIQSQLLLQERGFLAHKREKRGGNGSVGGVIRADADGGVGGVGPGLVADHHIKVADISGGHEQGLIGGTVIVARINAHGTAALQDGLINLD